MLRNSFCLYLPFFQNICGERRQTKNPSSVKQRTDELSVVPPQFITPSRMWPYKALTCFCAITGAPVRAWHKRVFGSQLAKCIHPRKSTLSRSNRQLSVDDILWDYLFSFIALCNDDSTNFFVCQVFFCFFVKKCFCFERGEKITKKLGNPLAIRRNIVYNITIL